MRDQIFGLILGTSFILCCLLIFGGKGGKAFLLGRLCEPLNKKAGVTKADTSQNVQMKIAEGEEAAVIYYHKLFPL